MSNSVLYLFGKHAVYHALKNPNRDPLTLFYNKNFLSNHPEVIKLSEERGCKTSQKDLQSLSGYLPNNCKHQGVILKAKPLQPVSLKSFLKQYPKANKIAILDKITDPHNIGAIYRSAAAFGIDCIVSLKNNSPSELAITANIACGGYDITPTIETNNLTNLITELKKHGFWAVGLDGNAKQTIEDFKKFDKTAIILGSEGKGISRLVKENADLLVKIPMTNKIDSLNVSNAASIVFSTLYNYPL